MLSNYSGMDILRECVLSTDQGREQSEASAVE